MGWIEHKGILIMLAQRKGNKGDYWLRHLEPKEFLRCMCLICGATIATNDASFDEHAIFHLKEANLLPFV